MKEIQLVQDIWEIMDGALYLKYNTKYGYIQGVKIGNLLYYKSSDSEGIEIYNLKKEDYSIRVLTQKTFVEKYNKFIKEVYLND